jgi:hypothetical protein
MNNMLTLNYQKNMTNIGLIIKESWKLISGTKWIFFSLAVLLPIAYMILLFFITILFSTYLIMSINLFIAGLTLLTLSPFLWVFTNYCLFCIVTILIMLGIRRSVGLSLELKTICRQYFRQFGPTLVIFLLWLIIELSKIYLNTLIPNHQVVLFITEQIIINYGLVFPLFCFTLPLIITKNNSAFQALKQTYPLVRNNGFTIIICTILMVLIIPISALPLGIGLIWTLPMGFIVIGILFRNATGLRPMSSRNATQMVSLT